MSKNRENIMSRKTRNSINGEIVGAGIVGIGTATGVVGPAVGAVRVVTQ